MGGYTQIPDFHKGFTMGMFPKFLKSFTLVEGLGNYSLPSYYVFLLFLYIFLYLLYVLALLVCFVVFLWYVLVFFVFRPI